MYRLFSWEHSYFSGKVRAYLRFKHRHGALGDGYEDILATPELVQGLLMPRSGSGAVPQMLTPDGTWVQDSSEIIDVVEAAHPDAAVIPDASTRPVQMLVAYLLELFGDEWMVVPGFWQRWYFSEDGRELSHRGFNEQQWGAMLAAGEPGDVRRAAAAGFFEAAFGISTSRSAPRGVYAGLVHLGCDGAMEHQWQASQHRILQRLEAHFSRHDFVLGGMPSLADYGLLASLYAHLYRDAVAGFALRTHFPIVCEWVERTNGEGALNARLETQKLYGLDDTGELVPRCATSDGGAWLEGDAIPETLLPVIEVFFEEMWPVLRDACDVLSKFIASKEHPEGGELPGKTFTATPGFEQHQTGEGALTHEFELGGRRGRRMVIPYQMWMLQRLEAAIERAKQGQGGEAAMRDFLAGFPRGEELLDLSSLLEGCRVRKEGALLYSLA